MNEITGKYKGFKRNLGFKKYQGLKTGCKGYKELKIFSNAARSPLQPKLLDWN